MADEKKDDRSRLLRAIKAEGEALQKREDHYHEVILRQQGIIERCQKFVEHYQTELKSNQVALEALRAEYKKLIKEMRNGEETG